MVVYVYHQKPTPIKENKNRFFLKYSFKKNKNQIYLKKKIESKIYYITSNLFEDYQQYCKHDHGYLGFPAQTVFCQI